MPADGAMPVISPVAGFIVTPLPNGEKALKGEL